MGGVGGTAGLGLAPSHRHSSVIFTGRQSHGYGIDIISIFIFVKNRFTRYIYNI